MGGATRPPRSALITVGPRGLCRAVLQSTHSARALSPAACLPSAEPCQHVAVEDLGTAEPQGLISPTTLLPALKPWLAFLKTHFFFLKCLGGEWPFQEKEAISCELTCPGDGLCPGQELVLLVPPACRGSGPEVLMRTTAGRCRDRAQLVVLLGSGQVGLC